MREKTCVVFWLFVVACFAANPLKIAVISDIHYLSPALMDDGERIQEYEKSSARNIRDIPAILDETLADLQSDIPDILLIPGDLTKDGELQSHLDLKLQLDKLAKSGTRIFVIPGNHDISVPYPVKYEGDKTVPTANISPPDFARIYGSFGYEQAFSRDTASLSYAVALDDNTWLIGIDSNRYREYQTGTISGGRVLPETEKWVLGLLAEARKKNITVLGMMHHGLVEHFVYQSLFFKEYLVNDWKRLEEEFADSGMKAIFTGHFHANDITAFTSPAGNTIYDIETGALSSFPFSYRKMQWKDSQLDIHTCHIHSIPGKANMAEEDSIAKLNYAIMSAKQRLRAKFGGLLPTPLSETIAELIGKVYIMHVCGDEKPDDDLKAKIEEFSRLMGQDLGFDLSDFQLDFPPADNDVKLDLKH